MRNLKRALSLTLASVMLLGMMVVGAGAASYPDVSEEDNVEAIEVLQAVQVMRGDDKGNFNPDSPVTRSEMAVIMALLLNLDYQYYEATCPFNDVPEWARPYVGACYANKIVSGYDATTYGSNDGVTPVQAASMMMRALGYFKYDVDYADGFETATVRQGTGIGIFDGVGSSANVAMTRNQVAQMALNALQCGMVEPDGNSLSITTPDGFTVAQGRTNYVYVIGRDNRVATAINDKTASSGTGNSGLNGYILDLGEQLYNGDLRKTSVNDGFGAPATRWAYKNTEIGTYADEADYKLEGAVKSSAMYSTVGKAVAEDYRWVVKMDGQTTNLNGDDPLFGKDEVKKNNGDDLAGTGRGTTTYIYLDNTAGGTGNNTYAGTATVCILNTYAAEVTKVADGKITLDDQDGKRLDFKTAGYSEDDVVLYNKYKDGSDWVVGRVIGEAELVEGEAKTVREDKYVVIGDTTYNYSSKFDDDFIPVGSAGAEVAIYLDRQGNIIYLGEVDENQDYALVLSVGYASNKYDATVSEFGAKLMLSDGTTLNVDLNKDFTDSIPPSSEEARATGDEGPSLGDVAEALIWHAVSYTKESDGTYKLEYKKDDQYLFKGLYGTGNIIENGRSSIVVGVDKDGEDIYAYTNSNTVFVLNDQTDGDTTYTAYTGYENVPDVGIIGVAKPGEEQKSTIISAYVDSKGIVKVVFITDGDIKGTDDVVFVVGDPGAKENRDSNGDRYYVYKAIVDGEATEIKVKKNSNADSAVQGLEKDEIGVYSRITKDSDGYVTKLVRGTNIKVTSYSGTQKLTGSVYGFAYDGKNYTYHIGPNSDTVIGYLDGSTLTVESNLQNDPNDPAIVVTKEGKLLGVFVKKLADDAVDPNAPVSISVEKGDGVESVTLTDADGKEVTTIKKGETVTVTVDLVSGYKDAKVEVTNADYADGKITNPTGAVTVKVTATKDETTSAAIDEQFRGKVKVVDATTGSELTDFTVTDAHIVLSGETGSGAAHDGKTAGDLYLGFTIPSGITLTAGKAVVIVVGDKEWNVNAGRDFATAGDAADYVAKANVPAGTITEIRIPVSVDETATQYDVTVKVPTGYAAQYGTSMTTDLLNGTKGTGDDIKVVFNANSEAAQKALDGVKEVSMKYSITGLSDVGSSKQATLEGTATGTVSGNKITVDTLTGKTLKAAGPVTVTITEVTGTKVGGELKVATGLEKIITAATGADSGLTASAGVSKGDEVDLQATNVEGFTLAGNISKVVVTYKMTGVSPNGTCQATATGTGEIDATSKKLTIYQTGKTDAVEAGKGTFVVDGDQKIVIEITGVTSIVLDKSKSLFAVTSASVGDSTISTLVAKADITLKKDSSGNWVNDGAVTLTATPTATVGSSGPYTVSISFLESSQASYDGTLTFQTDEAKGVDVTVDDEKLTINEFAKAIEVLTKVVTE